MDGEGSMKQFMLTIVTNDNDGKVKSLDKIEGDDLVELLAQLPIVVVTIQSRIPNRDDDFPF